MPSHHLDDAVYTMYDPSYPLYQVGVRQCHRPRIQNIRLWLASKGQDGTDVFISLIYANTRMLLHLHDNPNTIKRTMCMYLDNHSKHCSVYL